MNNQLILRKVDSVSRSPLTLPVSDADVLRKIEKFAQSFVGLSVKKYHKAKLQPWGDIFIDKTYVEDRLVLEWCEEWRLYEGDCEHAVHEFSAKGHIEGYKISDRNTELLNQILCDTRVISKSMVVGIKNILCDEVNRIRNGAYLAGIKDKCTAANPVDNSPEGVLASMLAAIDLIEENKKRATAEVLLKKINSYDLGR